MALMDIDTIVIAIMENRSFDHMLGYLALPGANGPVGLEGLKANPGWQASIANPYGDTAYKPKRLDPSYVNPTDPTHDYASIAMQIGTAPAGPGPTTMGGFVESYVKYAPSPPAEPDFVMGYYDQAAVPVFNFLARHFCVCDHWFASLPLGTQANRLMAMAGESKLLDNSSAFLPEQPLVYDWLTDHKVSWCAYQAGNFLPFFSLMPSWFSEIVTSLTLSSLVGGDGRFRRYERFRSEWPGNSRMPNVIFVEPEYTDGPHKTPNDDHPPTGVGPGQALLADLYSILTSNPARWAKTLLIVTYDEHGGFFDHVPPLAIADVIAGQKLATTGVRVPAFLISPYVEPGRVFQGALDHTSILELLAERFAPNEGYSVAVNYRQTTLDRISQVLTAKAIETPAPQVSTPKAVAKPSPAAGQPSVAPTPNAAALDSAVRKIEREHPELMQHDGWKDVRDYIATVPPPIPTK